MSDAILMELLERTRSRFYGKYRGTVSKVEAGKVPRIKAKVPAVLGDIETGWCMPCVPYAGERVGIAFIPEEGAGVWIEFEGGDVSYPIWTGCYWHANELPSLVKPDVKVIQTKSGHQIILDDHDKVITVTDASHNVIKLDRKGITIKRGRGKIFIKDGNVNVNDGGMEVT